MKRDCSNCGEKVSLFRVTNEFSCKRCGTKLKSNARKIFIIALVLWGLVITPALTFTLGVSLPAQVVDLALGIFILIVSFKLFLKVEFAN